MVSSSKLIVKTSPSLNFSVAFSIKIILKLNSFDIKTMWEVLLPLSVIIQPFPFIEDNDGKKYSSEAVGITNIFHSGILSSFGFGK